MEAFSWWYQNTAHANDHILCILDRYASTSTRTLLEVGCGRGKFLYDASKRGWKVTGMEICEELADFVVQQLRFPVLRCQLKDVVGGYDAVVLFDVLEHIYDPDHHAAHLKRLLNPGGLVVVKSPFGKTQLAKERLKKIFGMGTGDVASIGHINLFSPGTLNQAFVYAGLRPLAVVPARSFPPAIHGAGFRPELWLKYGLIQSVNHLTSFVHAFTGLNFGFNLVGLARS